MRKTLAYHGFQVGLFADFTFKFFHRRNFGIMYPPILIWVRTEKKVSFAVGSSRLFKAGPTGV
jgi:hypothetical protein